MSNILNSEDFGLKIYNRFPPKYREDDVGQKLALKRYLQALSDGGFRYIIQDTNGLLDIKDPSRTSLGILLNLYSMVLKCLMVFQKTIYVHFSLT